MFIPVNQPLISRQAKKNIKQAMDSGWLSSAGPFVKEFEESFAKYLGVKYAAAVCNGTAALHLALLSLGIGKNDEVIVPAFTMASTWLAVIYTGAKPIFIDCDVNDYNIDVKKIENKITNRTKAILPVHIYGQACAMDKIMAIAKKYKLFVVEDAAEAHGAEYKKRKCGSFGDINCFSFYANKIITTGEGGMIVTNDKKIYQEAIKFRNLYHSEKTRFIHEKIGYNYRMTNLQAAVGCGEMKNIGRYIGKKQWLANLYNQGLKNIPGIKIPFTHEYNKNVYWMYGIVIDKKRYGLNRDELKNELKKQGVDTRDFFYAPSDQPILKKYLNKESFPNSEYLSRNGLYLPSGLAITKKQINYIVKAILKLKYDQKIKVKNSGIIKLQFLNDFPNN